MPVPVQSLTSWWQMDVFFFFSAQVKMSPFICKSLSKPEFWLTRHCKMLLFSSSFLFPIHWLANWLNEYMNESFWKVVILLPWPALTDIHWAGLTGWLTGCKLHPRKSSRSWNVKNIYWCWLIFTQRNKKKKQSSRITGFPTWAAECPNE